MNDPSIARLFGKNKGKVQIWFVGNNFRYQNRRVQLKESLDGLFAAVPGSVFSIAREIHRTVIRKFRITVKKQGEKTGREASKTNNDQLPEF